MIKEKQEFYGQILILLSVLSQVFIVDFFRDHQRKYFEYATAESIYFLSVGIDEIERDIFWEDEDDKRLEIQFNQEGPRTGERVGDLILPFTNHDPWENWITGSTILSTIMFIFGSGLILYQKHFLKVGK